MPLFLLYLSNIGDVMAKSFKWIYAKVCLCRICPGVAKRRAYRTRRKIRALARDDDEDDVSVRTECDVVGCLQGHLSGRSIHNSAVNKN